MVQRVCSSFLRGRLSQLGGWKILSMRSYCLSVPAEVHNSQETKETDSFGSFQLHPEEKANFREFDFIPDDDDPADHHERMKGDVFRPNSEQYLRKLNYMIHEQRDLGGAMQVLTQEMKEMCVKPEQDHYRLLIHSFALVGHLEKAFQLYRQFRDRGLRKHPCIYSDLFLACTNSKNSQLALKKAHWLRKKMAEEHFLPNQVNYHAMIQAFGRCGDLEVAFELIDEMRLRKVPVTSSTFAFLLQGCISDKRHGFRHALLTWRMMRRKRVWANIHLYNLMLRAAQECGLGDVEQTKDILQACLPLDSRARKRLGMELEEGGGEMKSDKCWWEMKVVSEEEKHRDLGLAVQELPNILARRPKVENIVSLAPQDTPPNRLILMGGHLGLVDQMTKDRVKPDLKTISQLLRLAPNNLEVETEVMDLLHGLGLQPDVAFFNQLIKQRSLRGDQELARASLEEMYKHNLSPDILTFGNLALSCKDWKSVKHLVDSLKEIGTRLNLEILTALVSNMAVSLNPWAVEWLLRLGEDHQLKADKKLVEVVEKFYQKYRGHLLNQERGGRSFVPSSVLREVTQNGSKNWASFVEFYKRWLREARVDFNEDILAQYETSKKLPAIK